ncbi:MAG: cache domain-containing protein, partial [Campylobacterota bacterium]|nr:cache domain-containing protein [Campylobacterota bacterium]
MNKNYLIIVVFLLSIIIFPLSINVLKESEVQQFKEKNILEVVSQLELYLKALIKEKQSTTSVIAVGVASSSNIIDALKNKNFEKLDFKRYSLELKNKTDFKNVWFQLIDKNGISVQRSWIDFKGDKISNARLDLQKMIKNPKVTNTISVGKFDMTFKSMIPIYDNNKTFLGIIEVITHFNSISKELEKKGISAVFLVDKRYKKQITKPFSK